jgi:hypothetical protein
MFLSNVTHHLLAPHLFHVSEHVSERPESPQRSVVLFGSRTSARGVLDGPFVLHGGRYAVPTLRSDYDQKRPRTLSTGRLCPSSNMTVVLTQTSIQVHGVPIICSVVLVRYDVTIIRIRHWLLILLSSCFFKQCRTIERKYFNYVYYIHNTIR